MWRIVAIVGLVLVAGCSSGGSGSSDANPTASASSVAPATTSTSSSDRPAWLEHMGAPAGLAHEVEGGLDVWVDEHARMIYAQSCDDARRLTSEGQRWGPTPGGSEPGYAYACPS